MILRCPLEVQSQAYRARRLCCPQSNIESNATLVDRIFVRDHSADWHGIAIVMVGHERNLIGCLETRLDLAKCAFIRRTPHWNVVD
jgi:hypothetical protein